MTFQEYIEFAEKNIGITLVSTKELNITEEVDGVEQKKVVPVVYTLRDGGKIDVTYLNEEELLAQKAEVERKKALLLKQEEELAKNIALIPKNVDIELVEEVVEPVEEIAEPVEEPTE
jgi:hypothetical protein